MIPRLVLLGLALALAAGLGWLLPRLTAPPDRFRVALALLAEDRPADAAVLFDNVSWRGVAEYRAARYQSALGSWFQEEDVRNLYNMGNAYARLQEWGGAKAAYRKVLRLDPSHADARHNLDVVLRAERREREILDEQQNTKRMGRWQDGDLEGEPEAPDPGGVPPKTEPGENTDGDLKKAEGAATDGGASDEVGALGEKSISDEAQGGRTDVRGGEDALRDVDGGAGKGLALKESRRAVDLLMNRIEDDPARVLAARLRVIHRQRQAGE